MNMMIEKPWYKHFWVWFILAPPMASVVLGLLLVVTAYKHADDLVVDDYRKIGRAFEQQFERDRIAESLQVTARGSIDRDAGTVNLLLTLQGELPATLLFRAIHPTEADRDLETVLTRGEGDVYHGRFTKSPDDRRYLQLEPADRSWRVTSELESGADAMTFAATHNDR